MAGALTRFVIIRLARPVGFGRQMDRIGVTASLRRSGILRSPADGLGRLGFWAVFVLFAGATALTQL